MPDHYAVLADVNALVSQVPYTATSKPTAATVTQMIDDVANEIDAWLSTDYVVPVIAGASALQFLRNLCSWGVLGRAQESRHTAAIPEAQGLKSVWTKKYEEYINHVLDPSVTFLLRDAQKNADNIPKVASQIVSSNTLESPLGVRPHDHEPGVPRPTTSMVF